ncbi:MAG TPA: protein kinase [Gemmataceae bacterium]
MPTAACPGADLWREILHTAAAESWQEHLDACLECQETVGRLGAEDSTGREIASRLAALSRPWDREEALRRAIANLKDDVPPADTGPFGPAFDAPPDPELPSCLGPYELGEVIGRGAGGVVRKAFDPSLQRTVAVKLLAPRLAARPEARERFLREARAAARIAHDNAVTVHAVEEIGGQPFLVMQYVPGGSLQDRLDRGGPLPPRELLRLGAQVADALAAAHAQGLIHRDVKPANILLEEGGARARLSDFGLAQAAGADGAGTVAGTPAYMAPEQARGEPLDPRADLFGLGCVLYTMAAGRAPYRAGSTPDVLRQVCEEEPPPLRKLNPAVPERLEAIVRKLMAKDPADRYATAAEAAEALRREAARLEQPPQRWRRVLGGIAALLLVALGLGEATGTTQFLQAAITALRLPTPDGTLVVEIDDPGVKVTIDGQEVVLTGAGVHEVRLRPGEYRLRMNKDGRPEKTDVVTIQKEGRVVVRVSLEPGQVAGEPRPDGPHGKLRVEVTDPTATVSVGNRWNFTRADAPREYHLTPGEHTVWIDRPGRRVETRVVRI